MGMDSVMRGSTAAATVVDQPPPAAESRNEYGKPVIMKGLRVRTTEAGQHDVPVAQGQCVVDGEDDGLDEEADGVVA